MLIDKMMDWEDGSLSDTETLELFAQLIKSRQAWSLQGCYGRYASNLIESGLITQGGKITDKAYALLEENGIH
jgi:hypothetical protein